MSKILFAEERIRVDILGIMYLSKILKNAGHEVTLLQDKTDNIIDYLTVNDVDFVMFSIISGSHTWPLKKIKEIKEKFSNIKIVVGGPHFTFFPKEVEENNYIDYCVIGPGEELIVDIVEGRLKEKILKGNICKDINLIPHPDREILYDKYYDEFGKSKIKRFIINRDCPNACKYCFNHVYHKMYKDQKSRFFQHTSVDRIIEEIKEVKDKYVLETVGFNDTDLTSNIPWLEEFCDKFQKLGLKFGGSIRASNSSKDIIKMMAKAGCSFLKLSVESAIPETQKMLGRGNMTNEKIENTCNYTHEFGIKTRLQNMIGLPVEDPLDDAMKTYEFNKNLTINDSWVSIFQPYPGTDIWNYCIKNNFLNKDEKKDCRNFYDDSILNILNAKEISVLHKLWPFGVKYKLPEKLMRILIKQELSDNIKKEIQEYKWELIAKNFFEV